MILRFRCCVLKENNCPTAPEATVLLDAVGDGVALLVVVLVMVLLLLVLFVTLNPICRLNGSNCRPRCDASENMLAAKSSCAPVSTAALLEDTVPSVERLANP